MEAIKKYRYVLYSGAVRAGKTLLLANVAIRTCLAYPNTIGVLASYVTPQLRDVVFKTTLEEAKLYQEAFKKAGLDFDLFTYITSYGNMKIRFFNGSQILFKSCDAESKLRGLTLDFVGIDEPVEIDETIFKQFMNRLSGGHVPNPFILLATNPDNETHWIYKYFFKNPTEEFKVIETSTYDNVLLPNYKRYIKELEENLDEDWIRRFLRGKWGHFSGQIYKEFNPDVHVTSSVDNWNYIHFIMGVDWGLRNPTAMLVIGITRDRKAGVLEEFYQSGKTSDQIAKIIEQYDKKYHFKKIYIDRTAIDLISQCEILKLPVHKSRSEVASGIARIKSLLKSNALFIHPRCRNLIKEMQSYRYKRDKNGNITEEVVKENDHSCFDKETQILTLDGWKYFRDLNYTDKVATMNLNTKELEFQKPTNIITEYYNGYIYTYEGNIPLAVTSDHKILYSTQYAVKKSKTETLYYEKLYNIDKKIYIPKCSKGVKDTKNRWIIDGFLLGFYLAEGCKSISRGRKYIHLYNTNLRIIKELQKLYGGSISKYSGGNRIVIDDYSDVKDIYHLTIRSDFLFDNLPEGKAGEKYIPKEFLVKAGREELQKCFDGMIMGDGSIDASGKRITYNTKSKQLADDFQTLCSLLGVSSTIYKTSDTMYRIYVHTDKSNFYEMKPSRLKKIPYKDWVYSVTVPNGNVLVRRKGRVMFSGNCDALRYALMSHSTMKGNTVIGFVKRDLWDFI